MCGKFFSRASWRKLTGYTDLLLPAVRATEEESVLQTPMRVAPVVCLDEHGKRVVAPMRWGWIDPRAPDPLKKPSLMHARGETLHVKPTWKHAFEHGRGVVWANLFNIGEEIAPGKVKQWTCRRADGAPLAIAVIWECWEHPRHGALHVFVPVTTDSPPSIRGKDDRCPLLFSTEREIGLWLGEVAAPLADVTTLIRSYDGELIVTDEKRADAPRKAAGPKGGDQQSFLSQRADFKADGTGKLLIFILFLLCS